MITCSQFLRALLLWSCDRSLTVALEVSKALLGPIEYLMSMWPCPGESFSVVFLYLYHVG